MKIPPVIILGMHRSGTSCLTGSLQEAGLDLVSVDEKPHTNPKGNRENIRIMDLNNAVLEASGAAWHTPPEEPCPWTPEQRAWRDRLLADYPSDRAWGFKDPRTLLVLEGWIEALPRAQLVGTFRHPLRVASSLKARNGFEIERGFALWKNYNQRLLRATEGQEIPLICFDWPRERYDAALRSLTQQLGLHVPEAGFTFFEPDLRSNLDDLDAELPNQVWEVYQKLLERT